MTKATITVTGDQLRKLLINTIHLGNHVNIELGKQGAPVRDAIVPTIDTARATGQITWQWSSPNKVTVVAEWALLDDDDL